MIRQIRVVVGTHQRCLGEIRRCPRLLRSRCPRFWFKRSHRRWHRRWLRPRRSRHWRRTRRHRLYHGNRFYLQKWSQSRCQKPHYRRRNHFCTHRSDCAFHDTIAPRRMTVHMRKRHRTGTSAARSSSLIGEATFNNFFTPRLPSCRGKTLTTISIRFTVVLCRRISPHRLASRVFHAGDLRNDG